MQFFLRLLQTSSDRHHLFLSPFPLSVQTEAVAQCVQSSYGSLCVEEAERTQ